MTWENLAYWLRHRRLKLIDFETDCLLDLDAVYLRVVAEKQKKPGEGGA